MSTLSVVMPNYNHARYVGEALEAAASQSRAPKEIIVVDDASTDDSVAVIEAAARRHPFIRLVRHERNRGVAAAVQRGLELCTGDYVALIAADDRVLPGHFERSLGALERHPEAGLCTTLGRILGADGQDLGPYETPRIAPAETYVPPAEFAGTLRRFGIWIVTYSVVFKRSALLEAGGYGPENGPSPDGILNMVIPAKHGACFVPEPLVAWRKLDTGHAVGDKDPEKAIALIDGMQRRLTAPQFAGLFPPDVLAAWRRQGLEVLLYELNRLSPWRLDQSLRIVLEFPDRGWLDRLFASALRLHLEAGRLAVKGYHFLRQEPRERRRILARLLRRLAGGR